MVIYADNGHWAGTIYRIIGRKKTKEKRKRWKSRMWRGRQWGRAKRGGVKSSTPDEVKNRKGFNLYVIGPFTGAVITLIYVEFDRSSASQSLSVKKSNYRLDF